MTPNYILGLNTPAIMRCTGTATVFDDIDQHLAITSAVVTQERVSLDWRESGSIGHLEASSSDGIVYRGHYGYPKIEEVYYAEFALYRALDGTIALVGRWRNQPDGREGHWVIQLTPQPNVEGH